MVKHLSKLLLLVALCVPWALRAQETLTVCDGSATNGYVPVYGYYCDAYNRSQSVYPASLLSALPAGATISQLQYYTSQASVSWGTASFVVKIGETSQTSLSEWDNATTMTTVYTGSLSISSNSLVIVFDDPYTYSGGNLVIEIDQTETGDYVTSTYYGISQTNGSLNAYSYSGFSAIGSGNTRDFLPKVTFTYEESSSCARPTGFAASNITTTSADLSWTAGGSETAWNLKYVVDGGGSSDTVRVNGLATTSYSLSALSGMSLYHIYVQADCGGGDHSNWTETTFATLCAAATCSYELHLYDSYGDGWNGGSIIITQSGIVVQEATLLNGESEIISADVCPSAPIEVTYISGYYPEENSFELYSSYGILMTSFDDGSSMTSDEVFYTNPDPCAEPTCLPVNNLAASGITSSSALVSWTPRGEESQWDVRYKVSGGDYSSPVSVSSTSYSLSGLTANTNYTVAVRANCGGSDGESMWIEISFTTECDYTAVPFSENFDSYSNYTLPECWRPVTTYSDYPSTYSQSLYFYMYNAENVVALPPLEDLNTLMITFDGRSSGSSYIPDTLQVGVMEGNVFVPIHTWTSDDLSTTYRRYNCALDGYMGSGSRIALRANRMNYNYGYYYIDNVVVEEIPTCGHVENLNVTAVTVGAARLEWNSSAYGTYAGAQVEYKLSADGIWTVAGTTTDSSYLLVGLSESSDYDVRVKALCSGNDESLYENTSLSTQALGCLVLGPQTVDTVGDGTSSSRYYGPVDNYWGNSFYEYLVTPAEVTAGELTSIAFQYAYSTSLTNKTNVTIYLGTTDLTDLSTSSFVPLSQMTPVWTGSLECTQGWNEFVFNAPFTYDGTQQLVVAVDDRTGSYGGSGSSHTFYYHTTTFNSVYYRNDDNAFSGTVGGAQAYRPNMMFRSGSCLTTATCGVPAVSVDEVGAHSVQLSWIPGSTENTWKVYYKPSDESDYTLAATTTNMNYTVSNLLSETDYDFRVVAMCSSDDSNYATVSATTLPSCMPVTALTATNINNTGATITWTAGSANADWLNNNEVNYTLKYNVQGSSNITTVPVNGTSYVIANGAPATTYEVSVQANCGSEDGLSTIAYTTFTTNPLTAALPYSCNFNSVGSYQYYWMFLQEGQTNHWMVGNAAHEGNDGALYITNDDANNAYTNGSTSYAYAFVQLNLADSGEYEYSFDWSGYGEGNWDFMRVALVPISTTLTYSGSGTSFGSGSYSASTIPTGAIVLDGGKLNLSSDWASLDGVVNISGAQRGMYRLVFYWRNDNSAGSNPPAAVDNVVFKRLTCHKPTALTTVYDTNNFSVQLAWTNNEEGASTWEVEYGPSGFVHGSGAVITASSNPVTIGDLQPNQIYDFYVRNICGADDLSGWSVPAHVTTACGIITALPYTATFEGNPTGAFAKCWAYNGSHASLSDITSGTSYVHRGTRAMRIRQHDTITENQYAAMNAVAANLPMNGNQVTFYSRCNTGNTTVTVGVMSDPEDASTFSAIKTLNLTTAYTAYNVMLDAYNGTGRHLAFMVAPAAANYIYIDDVTLDYMPECPTPDGMLAVSTDDGIRLNWDGHKSTIDQWQIRYTWKHIDSTEAYRQVDTLIVNANERRADGSYIFENPELVTNYTFAVRNVCDAVNNEYSEWSTVADLTTDICSNMFIDTIGTTDTVSRILPVTANYNNSYTQQIVLASEIETKASISALRLLFAYTENYRYKNNVTIYMGLTEKTEFTSNTDFIPLSTMTQVYSGALNITADSWNQIIFTTPFEYTDTTKNVVIAFLDNSARSGNNQNVFAVANTGANRSIYFRSSSTINPSASNNGTRTNKRNVMQLVNCVNCSAPSNPVSLSTYTSATAQWTDNAVALGHQVYIVPANEVNAQTIENIDWENDAISAPNSNYTFANLDSATTYMWVARNVCAAGINSEALTSYVSTKKFVDLSVCDNESTGYAFAPTAAGTYAGNVQTEYQSEGVYNNMYTTVHVSVRATSSTTDVQTACDEYTWSANGMSYLASNNTDVATLTNAAGCDSVVALNLTVNYSTTGTDVQTACNTYTWIDGNAYTASNNTATYTLTNAVNCDSVVTLDLTVNYSDTTAYEAVACDTYTWPLNGHTYTSSNNSDFVKLTNQYGCDSIVVLNLTVGYSGSYTATVTACDSYEWNGNTYTASTNAPTLTLTNQYGCDSTVNLHLTVNYSTAATDVHTACDSYTWIDGNAYIASNNTATYTLTNAVNCDSVVTLDLTVKYSTFVTDEQVACDSYTWQNGTTYTASTNAPKVTYPSANGCDSVITLSLVVNYSAAATDVINACDSYTWIDGNEYTASNNTATYTLTNAVHCDSLVTLDLTVGYTSYYTDVITACLTYTWIDGNTYTASTNAPVYTFNGGNAEGCDSVVTLNLTVNPKYTVTYHANHPAVCPLRASALTRPTPSSPTATCPSASASLAGR